MQDEDPRAAQSVRIVRVRGAIAQNVADRVAVESPLEIRVVADGEEHVVTVTMRTPGADGELAVGFLYAEGLLAGAADVATVAPCSANEEVVRVTLLPGRRLPPAALGRRFGATSSCGVCGSESVAAVLASAERAAERRRGGQAGAVAWSAAGRDAAGCGSGDGVPRNARRGPAFRVRADVLRSLPARLRSAQPTFESTGGLHAVAAFDAEGALLAVREDVGRHNALDKLVGAALLAGRPDPSRSIVVLSGRAGFEMVQKAAVAGVPVLAAIGAPSSLAVELAERAGVTLVGFLRDSGFNVYSGAERIVEAEPVGEIAREP